MCFFLEELLKLKIGKTKGLWPPELYYSQKAIQEQTHSGGIFAWKIWLAAAAKADVPDQLFNNMAIGNQKWIKIAMLKTLKKTV